MIQLKKMLLQYKDATQQLTQDQFIILFKENCKNIKDISQIVYRGVKFNDNNYRKFDGKQSTHRISAHMHGGRKDTFYNIYMSTSQA